MEGVTQMPDLSYRQSGLVLERGGGTASREQVRDLQRDLRALGYLRSGIDGVFGGGTELAVRSLQRDLLMNDGASTGDDGDAPVRVVDYNRGRVSDVTGQADQALVACLSDILDDPQFPTLPSSENPVEANEQALSQIARLPSPEVPSPFLVAILRQESDLQHFHVPGSGDDDTYISIGLDFNDPDRPDRITSRGYGVGQYTLFHHPPRSDEVAEFMVDVGGNVRRAIAELLDKFEHFVNGSTSGTRADDRIAEAGAGPLRLCKYASDDPRYMRDCRQCAAAAGMADIEAGETPVYAGAELVYEPTQYYHQASFTDVPVRKDLGCDWPYAARRYNGSGINSYLYQVRILQNLAQG